MSQRDVVVNFCGISYPVRLPSSIMLATWTFRTRHLVKFLGVFRIRDMAKHLYIQSLLSKEIHSMIATFVTQTNPVS